MKRVIKTKRNLNLAQVKRRNVADRVMPGAARTVSDEQFKELCGISVSEYTQRMMRFVQFIQGLGDTPQGHLFRAMLKNDRLRRKLLCSVLYGKEQGMSS